MLHDQADLDIIHELSSTPLEEWPTASLTRLIAMCNTEIYEWEKVKAEAYKYL